MTPADLAGLHARCFTVPRPWSEAEFLSLLALPGMVLVQAPGGFALGRIVADEAEILTIAVAPEVRRQGVGGRLLRDLLERVAEAGAETAFLEVAQNNPAALVLYERAGFTLAGRRRGYYRMQDGTGIDALILRRDHLQGSPQF